MAIQDLSAPGRAGAGVNTERPRDRFATRLKNDAGHRPKRNKGHGRLST